VPYYLYQNKKTLEIREISQKMTDLHVYFSDGIEWQRLFLPINGAVDTKFDPFSSKDFVEKTRNRSGNLGDIMEKSAELSQKRAEIAGKDELKKNYYKNYTKKRKGKLHKDIKEKQAIQNLDNKGITIDYD